MSDSDQEEDADTGKGVNQYIVKSQQLTRYGWGDMSLRPYQLAGVNWMIERYKRGHGCILGDEMGLGKTCQTIAVIAYLHGKSTTKHPHLVVCPLAVLKNWNQEIERFAPGLKSLMYFGEKEARQELGQQLKRDFRKGNKTFDVLLTTYEVAMKDSAILHSVEWNLLIVDEAHRLKNINSLLHKTLSQWDFHTGILLTGTPVQNNLQELYSLLNFVAAKKFPASGTDDFVQRFSKMKKSASELHKLLKPYLLLRRKSEVLKDLPSKSEVVLTHGISKLQTKLYKGILTKDLDVFESETTYGQAKQTTSLMNILMQLRKCVNHPYLFDGVEPEPFELGEHLVEASGKLVVIDNLLKHLKAAGHKVLMFSQMTHMLDILQDYLGYRGYSYERLDGSVRGEERFLAIQKFNESDETFVFLLSTRAGGQGINLTSADTVIFVDSDFNPQNDLQAAARAHRIGQTRPVKIIRLVGKNTVEEIVLRRAEEKLKLTKEVIKEGEFSLGAGGKQGLFTDDRVKLQDILKYGVDELFGESAAEDNNDLDLDSILGPSVAGSWQPEETPESPPDKADDDEDEGIIDDIPQTMYMFEGTDYSKEPTAEDKTTFDKLIQAEKTVLLAKTMEERPLRTKRQSTVFMGGLPEVLRKPRKKLSPEELEERKKKREEAAARRAKEAEEQEMRAAQKLKQKKEDLWRRNSYESCNIEMDSASDNSDDDDADVFPADDDDDGENSRRDIRYVSGDVTLPRKTDAENNIIIHCADDSGNWGRGGLFTAIATRSPIPEQQYTLAGKMQDLALGDCHLISLDDVSSRKDGHDQLALLIAQHRDKKNRLSGIKLSALRYGLEKVYTKAKQQSAAVHLPRIGHDTPGFNWYGTEKLIKKHLAAKGIPTYIYYFPRRHQKKRKATDTDTPAPTKLSRSESDVKPSTSGTSSTSGHSSTSHHSNGTAGQKKKSSTGLLDIFAGQAIHLHKEGIAEDDFKKYKRYIIAYDGDLNAIVTDSTSHVVIAPHCDNQAISKLTEDNPEVTLVSTEWLDDCLQKRKLLKTDNYEIS